MDETPIANAIKLFGWVGTPPIELDGKVLDGRKRLRACTQFGITPPATFRSTNVRLAVLALHHAGESQRAWWLANERWQAPSVSELAALLAAPKEVAAAIRAAVKGKHKPRPRPKYRKTVVDRVRKLYHLALEGDQITAEDLRNALGEWL